MKITEKDLKLLVYLYHNNRESLAKIARETGLSRIQVEYKLNKFMEEGIIKSFFTIFNYNYFGYRNYILAFIKLEKYSSINKLIARLEESKNCISLGECFGKYDLFVNLIFKNEDDINNFMSDLMSSKEYPISNYIIIRPYLTELHPLKIASNKKNSILPIISEKSEEKNFSKKDLEILKILSNNSRESIIKIARKTGISAEMVLHKIKKFQREKIIIGSRTEIKMKKLGYNYSIILLNIRNLSTNTKEKIINFSRKEKRVNSLILQIFDPNCIIQIFHETEDELKNEVIKIKELLKEETFDLDVILAQEENKINTLPFLK